MTAIAAASCCVFLTIRFARRFGAASLALGARRSAPALCVPELGRVRDHGARARTSSRSSKGRNRAAGIALGIGAGIKLFPLVVVPVLGGHPVATGPTRRSAPARGERRGLTFLAVNLPVFALAPHRWWWTYEFQSHRQATWGSAWSYVFRALELPVHGAAGAQLANVVSMCALLGGLAWLVWHVLRHDIDHFAAAAAAVAIFIVSNKVYSPTYDVWLVAFFVMVPFSRRLWLTFCAVDLAVFITVYGYFHQPRHRDRGAHGASRVRGDPHRDARRR